MKHKIESFISINKTKILVVFFLYLFPLIAIGNVNYPYIDDIGRRIEGVANFAEHYSRFLSEFASYLVHGGTHLADAGLTTFILCAVILTLTSFTVLYLFKDGEEISWSAAIASVFLGLNPWFLEPLSFRFDAPYISLSVLVSVLPFVFYRQKPKYFALASFVGIFLMCNSYQGSSGIYILTLLALVTADILEGKPIVDVLKKIAVSFIAYSAGIVTFFFQTKLNPHLESRGETTQIASLRNMPHAVVENLRVYFETLKLQSNRLWLLLALLIILGAIVTWVWTSKRSKICSLFISLLSLGISSIMSYGLYMFFATPLADDRPRYAYGFAFFIGLLLIQLTKRTSLPKLNAVKSSLAVLVIYYTVSFSFMYASVLDNQKQTFENSSFLLADDLNNFISEDNQTVYISSFLKDSQVFENSAQAFPMLRHLVPSNASLYWPNFMWFNSLTDLNVNFVGLDFNTINMDDLEPLLSNKNWDIYQFNNEIYVYTK
ncbi:glucosyltransferase domain-containing protein [Streptococcus moroccensis]|uniref:Drug/metabolite transporter superfamily protein YnfA n=1 Tax=Streptococcus moroccensis TaxID=1451356 RepID=A0ABT9YQL5_9STRE|nr:glucosyltransferase domain-containing protein [Streptococcus moroccensis]MDQ0222182.1 drug/metabolite transporter superfamily protein YnfA [Streptococcus moroccensis]